jgi:hypothetical protein
LWRCSALRELWLRDGLRLWLLNILPPWLWRKENDGGKQHNSY